MSFVAGALKRRDEGSTFCRDFRVSLRSIWEQAEDSVKKKWLAVERIDYKTIMMPKCVS